MSGFGHFKSDDDEPANSPGMPTGYSPRPNGDEDPATFTVNGINRNNPLAGFELKFGDDGGANQGLTGYSPRPDAFNSREMENTPELAQIFSLITEYQPADIPMVPFWKPFIPDLIPSIGAIDAFIKVPRPDDEADPLGLTVLDEPTIGCSDPQILNMQLREKYGIVGNQESDGYIGSIQDLENNQKALDVFLESYEEINRNRPPPTMTYSSTMPNFEALLQEFPEEMEDVLKNIPLPDANMDLTIEEYAKIICVMLDIPVRGNIIESLHMLFSLYEQFHDHFYFNQSRGSTPATQGREERIDL
ncbi:LOC300675 protein, putative [Trichomonas vaginalis G3]|uniref:LOC300675 protein, putative n=1 Tax=Trichomonas vaginalis (strain ATCC PRA-98 / G3) TaxID=412133 RepID=A2FZ75_TRIV3|nr:intraciliary transport [Trichomonas vaginalis G3]EAX89785.1 LOC300675 protein, putative [Trichomonas vaginalis G3]KAI5538757.1 intraciliary transport [Trichomonas vaginalis G3]|eukprot:XP_001302715.1 LOC300675 protein [Trichomonas vaginalis G3]